MYHVPHCTLLNNHLETSHSTLPLLLLLGGRRLGLGRQWRQKVRRPIGGRGQKRVMVVQTVGVVGDGCCWDGPPGVQQVLRQAGHVDRRRSRRGCGPIGGRCCSVSRQHRVQLVDVVT